VNPILGVFIIAIAMVAIEAWDLRGVALLLGILGGLLTVESIFIGAVLNAIPLTLFAVFFIPVSVYFVTTRSKFVEEPALISRGLSIILLIVLVVASYAISLFLLGVADIQWSLILVGVYGLLSKTDLRKIVASVAILTYAVHLLIPAFDVIIEGVLLVFSGGLILVLLFFAVRIFTLNESVSTRDLRKLKQ